MSVENQVYVIKKDGKQFFITPSKKQNKKYDVYIYDEIKDKPKYLISFGDRNYEHYFDKIGYYSYLNHNDSIRKKRYYDRFGKTNDYTSAKYWSNYILW